MSPTFRVRGTGSISADNDPLTIIDGFPASGGLSQINANDIQSIEILKDAASDGNVTITAVNYDETNTQTSIVENDVLVVTTKDKAATIYITVLKR